MAAAALPETEKAKKVELLARAVTEARAEKDPAMRLCMLGWAAARRLDLGEGESAKALFHENEALARAMPNAAFAGYARGVFAEELGRIDLDTALALMKDLSDRYEYDRHHGNLAHELADCDPAATERVLAMVREPLQRGEYTVRVAYRMARRDPARALRLARAIETPTRRAYGFGMVALALAQSDRSAAEKALDEALAVLDDQMSRPLSPVVYPDPCAVAAALVPVAERIDPQRVQETIWRALALRRPRDERDRGQTLAVAVEDGYLALMLARYDRALARALLEPWAEPSVNIAWIDNGLIAIAASAIDPRWGVALVERIPDSPDARGQSPKNEIRLRVTGFLARTGEQRWRHVQSNNLRFWVPDVVDFDLDL